MQVCVNVYVHTRTFLIRKVLPGFRELLPLVLCSNPLLPQHPEHTHEPMKHQ